MSDSTSDVRPPWAPTSDVHPQWVPTSGVWPEVQLIKEVWLVAGGAFVGALGQSYILSNVVNLRLTYKM